MKKLFLFLFTIAALAACTDLEEELREDLPEGADPDPAALLQSSYDAMRLPFQDQSRFWAAQEHTSDECLGPTRGPDWDDNGIWRTLHNHSWDADHAFLGSTFSELLQIVFATSNLLQFGPTPQQAAESRFLRAYVVSAVLDGWGQVPFRRDGTSLLDDAEVLQAQEAVDFIVSEVDAIINDLPDGPTNRANKDAARMLKAKVLLNKGMYLDRANPSFDNGDMSQVISIADQIMNSGKYSLADNYFDNFAPNNDQISTENIWTAENVGGSNSGNVRSRWYCTLHYNQNPSGWNGFATLGDFYASFEEADV
ncbi:MAG: RagB/SusD family nutrient uptake outer membrane protein, partial [Bacteroidota bacterium]